MTSTQSDQHPEATASGHRPPLAEGAAGPHPQAEVGASPPPQAEVGASPDPDPQTEVEALRARVAELERELLEREAWANRAVAEAQQRTYWLDRWGVDLNAVMQRPGASQFRAAVRVLRDGYRVLRRARRRLKGE